MRTKIYLATLLVLAIQVMVNGQTQDNQSTPKLGNVVKHHTPSIVRIQKASDGRLVIPATTQANSSSSSAELLEITAFETESTQNKEIYANNKEQINDLLPKSNLSAIARKEVRNLISDAEKNMRLAGEIHQESYAMPTVGAKLGSLSNANEKEIIAISDQNQAIHLLKSYAAIISLGMNLESYAVK